MKLLMLLRPFFSPSCFIGVPFTVMMSIVLLFPFSTSGYIQKILISISLFFYAIIQLFVLSYFFDGTNEEIRDSDALGTTVYYKTIRDFGLPKTILTMIIITILFSFLIDLISWSLPFSTLRPLLADSATIYALHHFRFFGLKWLFISLPLLFSMIIFILYLYDFYQSKGRRIRYEK